MTNNRRYYFDSYTRAFSARLVERVSLAARPAVVLDATYFYPASGGQPADLGAINGVPVVDVTLRESDGAILHWLTAEVADDEVSCEIDWPRRWDHMQQHTGQHILSQACLRTAEAETVSFHLGADGVSIDLAGPPLSPAALARAEDLANDIVQRNLEIKAWFPVEAELRALPLRREPKVKGAIRIVAIGDFDFTACGGTHVAHTGELGLIKILGATKAGKDTRVEFLCGARAQRDYHRKHTLAAQIAAGFSVGLDEVESALARLRAENQDLRRALNTAKAQLLDAEAAELLAAASIQNGLRLIRRAWLDRDPAELRGLAERLPKTSGVLALLGTAGEKTHLVFARSADVPHNMGALIKPALTTLGGRGGGSPTLAQGGGSSSTLEAVERVLAAAQESAG